MTERSLRTVRELEGAAQGLDQEAKRLTAEFDIAKRDLEKARRDAEHRNGDLQRLSEHNKGVSGEQPEMQLEQMEREWR